MRLLLILVLCLANVCFAASSAETLSGVAAQWEKTKTVGAIAGKDGWYFLTAELRSFSRGPFWGPAAVGSSVAEKQQDPLPAIVSFHKMLKAANIELIVLPVPGKICVYADKLDAGLSKDRWDTAHQEFYAALKAEGVQVIDILPELLAQREAGTAPYCKQDSHWSPAAMQLAATRISNLVKAQAWYAEAPKKTFTRSAPVTVDTRGDLVAMLGLDGVPAEPLTVQQVAGAEPDKASPIVLIGDSHTLVYHDRDLLAEKAGLPEQLAAELGIAVDLLGVRGSGANASRVTLARRKDNLAGKKCVIWVFSAREFTESQEGWKLIPVIR